MAFTSSQNSGSAYPAKSFCRIVGLTCVVGFAIDFVIIVLPPNPLLLEWRVGFLQQVSDRSIVLLLGAALTLYGFIDSRRWLRQSSLISLLVGVLFILSCGLTAHDVSVLQQQSVVAISDQAAQIQTQIQQAQSNPTGLPQNITLEQLTQASQQVAGQAETLKQNAKTNGVRAGFSTIGKLLIVGVGLMTLGRYGVRLRRS